MSRFPAHNPECSDSRSVSSESRRVTSQNYPTRNKKLRDWVNRMARMCEPDSIVWIDGSKQQKESLEKEAIATAELISLDPKKLPGCFLHRTALDDVARTEHLTFICTRRKHDAGPTNNWMSPRSAYIKAKEIFKGAMRGRTMYVIPFSMGPVGSPFSKIGVELTDSGYVVLYMLIMARVGENVFTPRQNWI
jgi:phosphoenolpyruvate carboxykinase (GTP)